MMEIYTTKVIKMEGRKDILVKNIDVALLRKQRNYLLNEVGEGTSDEIDGIINLLDWMLDEADGEP